MLPSTVQAEGDGGVSQTVPIDLSLTTAVGLFVKVAGTVDFTVQFTADDVWAVDFDASTATWYPYDTGTSDLVNGTANASGNFAAPPTGVRVIHGATNSSGTSVLTVIQSGLTS